MGEDHAKLAVFASGTEALEALCLLRDHGLVEADIWALHPVAYYFHLDRRLVLAVARSRADEALGILRESGYVAPWKWQGAAGFVRRFGIVGRKPPLNPDAYERQQCDACEGRGVRTYAPGGAYPSHVMTYRCWKCGGKGWVLVKKGQ